METKRISLDFDEEDEATLEEAKGLLRKKLGQTTNVLAIRYILREFVAAAKEQEQK